MKRVYSSLSRKANVIQILGVLVLALSMIFSFAACGEKNTNRYTLPDVTEGDTFEITLNEPYADGGWSWNYEISSSGIEFVTEKFVADNDDPDVLGSPGKGIFTFRATKAGHYKIKFKYQRSWEPETSLKETNIYEIKVIKAE